MPSAQETLANLEVTANGAIVLALVWHGIALVVAIALLFGWRPSQRQAGALLGAPLASAAAVAFVHDNPFNGIVLGGVTLGLAAVTSRMSREPIRRAGAGATTAGVVMMAFGLVYPHFLHAPALTYLLAAPTGVLPCPTLSLVIGFTLLWRGLGSHAWSLILAIAGALYGAFGFVRLGVHLDAVLLAGSAWLLFVASRLTASRGDEESVRRPPIGSATR